METNLSSLPTELIGMIFEELDTPKDLVSLIIASSHCHRIFAQAPARVIRRALKLAVPTQLWSEFCAANIARSTFHPVVDPELLEPDEDMVNAFLARYFGPPGDRVELPRTLESMTAAHKLHCAISSSIADFTRKAALEARRVVSESGSPAQAVQNEGQPSDEPPLELEISETERFRLYRAFLRFEIYARVFRPPQTNDEIQSYQGKTQFALFLSKFQPWEVEEITSVHQYFADIVENTLEEMDDEFKAEVHHLAAEAYREKAGSRNKRLAYTLTGFSDMDGGRLFQFSDAYRQFSVEKISSIVSSGIVHMSTFARSDKTARFTSLRTQHHNWGPFLCDALPYRYFGRAPVFKSSFKLERHSYITCNPIATVHAPVTMPDPEPPTVANQGFARYRGRAHGHIHALGVGRYQLRRLGYVFWDAARLDLPVFRQALLEVERGNYQLRATAFPRIGHAPESRIQHIILPVGYYRSLVEKFGSIGDTTVADF